MTPHWVESDKLVRGFEKREVLPRVARLEEDVDETTVSGQRLSGKRHKGLLQRHTVACVDNDIVSPAGHRVLLFVRRDVDSASFSTGPWLRFFRF